MEREELETEKLKIEKVQTEKLKTRKINYSKIKEATIAIIFIIWILIPMLKEIKITSGLILENEYKFMELAGIIGIYLGVYHIYKIIKTAKGTDKTRAILKEILPFILLTLYLIWTLISCVLAKDINKSFYGSKYRLEGYITYLIYAGFCLNSYIIKSNKIKKTLLVTFLIIAVSNIALIKLVHINTNLVKYFYYTDMKTGIFDNSNHYGYYLLMAVMVSTFLFIKEKNCLLKIVYALAYGILLYTLIVNNTFGSYLAGAITLIIFLIYSIYNKKHIKSSVIVILIFIILSSIVKQNGQNIAITNIKEFGADICKILNIDFVKEESNTKKTNKNWERAGNGRARLWKYGLIMISQKPILGYGAENLEVEYQKYNINADRPHNLLIQLGTTSGIPGLILYVSAVVIVLLRGRKHLKECNEVYLVAYFVVLAYLISAMFGNSMYYTSPYFFMFLGMIV